MTTPAAGPPPWEGSRPVDGGQPPWAGPAPSPGDGQLPPEWRRSTPPGQSPPPAPAPGGVQVCFRHPDRATGLRCARCGRPSCPECLREAAVGFQCVVCVDQGGRDTRAATTVAGAPLREGRPLITPVLVAVNVAVFLVTAVLAGDLLNNSGSALFGRGSLIGYAVAEGEWWRVFTSGFLHFGVLHIAVNMYALFILGRELEVVLGRWRYGAVYAVSLLGGSASVLAFERPDVPTVGASGAVFGLLGGLAVVLLKLRRSVGPVFTIIAINIVISFTVPGISLFGHLGGLAVGAAATAVLVHAPSAHRTRVQAGGLVALTVLAVVVIAARSLVLRDQLGI